MKKLVVIVIASFFTGYSFSQPLTGIKTIKASGGDYATFSDAIASLNNNGVGSGGVTFNVDAGFVDSAANLVITDSTATVSNPIIFQKAGTGNNPLIIAKAGTGNMDGIIKITGTDYITFNKIDLLESSGNTSANARMEWGYALLKPSISNGCKHVTIKNCKITLTLVNGYANYGIYSANHNTKSTTDLALKDSTGINEYNSFFSDTIMNVFGGIIIKGYNASSGTPIYDRFNIVGVGAGNYISNFSGSGNTTEAGIYVSFQNNISIANNMINGGGITSTAPLYGIFTTGGTNSNIDIYNNTVTLISGATGFNSSLNGISNSIGNTGTTNTINIYNNLIKNCKYSGTSGLAFYGISNTSSAFTINIYNNTVTTDSIGGTGSFYAISVGNGNTLNCYSNKVFGNGKTGTGGNLNCFSVTTSKINFYKNLIYNNSLASGTGAIYGYTNNGGSPSSENIYGNKMYNLTHNGNGNVYGVFNSNGSTNSTKKIYSDTIYGLSSSGGSIYGIYSNSGGETRLYNNSLYNFTNSATNGSSNGIYINSGAPVYIYNNTISDLKSAASTSNTAVNGIYINNGTSVNAYFNTVYLNASSSSITNFGTAAIYASSTPTLDLRNNIFVNNSNAGPAGGKTSAFQKSNTTLTAYSNSSDNNCFYAGTPSSRNVIFYDGTNFDSTINQYKARVTGRDGYSFSENPPFINDITAPYNLHLSTSIPTECESGGSVVTKPISITDDIDAQTRNSRFPDVGSDEGAFTKIDKMQPRCIYTPLISTALNSIRLLTATIIDPSGIPGAGNGMPVLYWKIDSNGTWNNVQAIYSGSGDQFDFTFGTGVTTGDTVFYYIVAQDSASMPNVGVYPSTGSAGLTANPPAAVTPPSNPEFYVIIPGFPGGNYRIGGTGTTPAAGCTYVDLTAALADITPREITGPINLILTKDYYTTEEDTFPLVVKEVIGQNATNTITIKPDTNVVTAISYVSASAIFKFDGAKYFIIDGSNNGTTSRDLTISDSSVANNIAAIWIGSQGVGKGSNHIVIKNCNILLGGNVANNYGIFLGNSSAIGSSGADNDNISLINNYITNCWRGIGATATSAGTDDSLSIIKNMIGYSDMENGSTMIGISLNGYINNSLVSQNEIGEAKTTSSNTGIEISNNISNTVFSKNKIHDLVCTGTGYVYGMYISGNSSNLQFDNNIVYNIISISSTYGIYSNQSANCSFYYNSVYLSGDRDAVSTNKATNPSYAFYTSSNSTNLTLKNNIFQNSQLAATNPTSAKSYAIYNSGTSTMFSAINYNDYYVSGAQGVLAYQGGDITSFAAWKTANTADVNSISTDPQFNSPSNLQPGIVSPVLAAGTPISLITTDIAGIARSSTKPSIGAYETGADVTGPAIIYTAFSNTSSTSARTLTAMITDPSGVPTSGAGLPVLYWKKNVAGTWSAITGVSIGSDQYTFTYGSGVVVGDSIFYYIAAQDKYSPINVSVFPLQGASGFTSAPPAVGIPPSNPSLYLIIGAISAGNYDIGGSGKTPCATCTYVDLTAAFNDIATKEITGAITLSLTSYYKCTEENSFPITINPLTGVSAANTVTIKPAPGSTDTISANSATGIIRLYGAKYIIIDGSNNGSSSRNLLIQNTASLNAQGIQIASRGVNNGSNNINIKNTIFMSGNTSNNSYGIYSTGDDNDNITIQNNLFLKSMYGIYALGTTNGRHDNLVITGNVLSDTASANSLGRDGMYINLNNGTVISNNYISNLTYTSGTVAGIYLTQCSGASVSNNTITNFKTTATIPTGITIGTGVVQSNIIANKISNIKYTGTTSGGGRGIDIGTGASNLLIANNMISGLSGTGAGTVNSNAIIGIRITNNSGIVNIYHNTVNLSGKITHTGTAQNKSASLYIASNATALDIRNNIFTNSIFDTTGINTSYAIYSDASTGSFSNLNFNNYYVSDSQGVLGYFAGSNDSTIQAWRTATGKDSNSLNINPGYVSDADLHISNLYLNSAGDTASVVTDDIDGNPRFADHPDIGADEFGLLAVPTTLGSDNIMGSTATVRGKLNPMNEYNTVVVFEYGTSTVYGSISVAQQSPVSGMADTNVFAYLTGLTPQTTYHYRITATTSQGISYGKDSTFLTTVSIKENHAARFANIYMNGKSLIVELNGDLTNASIMLYDLFGKEIFSSKMNGKEIQLDLGNTATGYYLVNIISDKTLINKKLFVK